LYERNEGKGERKRKGRDEGKGVGRERLAILDLIESIHPEVPAGSARSLLLEVSAILTSMVMREK
jgi:hypothetical protein